MGGRDGLRTKLRVFPKATERVIGSNYRETRSSVAQSDAYRTKRDLIAKWLWDLNEQDEAVPYGKYWRHAADLIKFLTANGCDIHVSYRT